MTYWDSIDESLSRMGNDAFRKFLRSEARKKPLKIEGCVDRSEVLRDAEYLAGNMSFDDHETIRKSWQKKSFDQIAFVLRKYGLDFKGLTYMETLVSELFKITEQKTSSL